MSDEVTKKPEVAATTAAKLPYKPSPRYEHKKYLGWVNKAGERVNLTGETVVQHMDERRDRPAGKVTVKGATAADQEEFIKTAGPNQKVLIKA